MQQEKLAQHLTRAKEAINEAENALQGESSPKWEPQTIYLPPDLRRRVKAHAALAGREISDIAAQALLEYLARAEKRG